MRNNILQYLNLKTLTAGVAALLLMSGAVNQALAAPANTVVVAKAGGDFTSIQAAIDATSPTADNPLLIQVMPGTYEENFTLKSHTHVQGSGVDVSIIQPTTLGPEACAITAYGQTNVTISDLTITTITPSNATDQRAICAGGGTSAIIMRNKIVGNAYGIIGENYPPTVPPSFPAGNLTISDNDISGNYLGGVVAVYETISVVRNKVLNNGWGLYLGGGERTKPAIVRDNEATGNTTIADIALGNIPSSLSVNVSFNIVNNVAGKGIRGLYNVKSDGSSVRLP